jgi:hypothetical protein
VCQSNRRHRSLRSSAWFRVLKQLNKRCKTPLEIEKITEIITKQRHLPHATIANLVIASFALNNASNKQTQMETHYIFNIRNATYHTQRLRTSSLHRSPVAKIRRFARCRLLQCVKTHIDRDTCVHRVHRTQINVTKTLAQPTAQQHDALIKRQQVAVTPVPSRAIIFSQRRLQRSIDCMRVQRIGIARVCVCVYVCVCVCVCVHVCAWQTHICRQCGARRAARSLSGNRERKRENVEGERNERVKTND